MVATPLRPPLVVGVPSPVRQCVGAVAEMASGGGSVTVTSRVWAAMPPALTATMRTVVAPRGDTGESHRAQVCGRWR